MSLELTILYRGSLSSCNYDCSYCPFAKRHETAAELRVDREQLTRFVDWIESRSDLRLAVFFTPWGEGLTRRWYRDSIVRLTQMDHVGKVAIQTNLSCDTDWIAGCNLRRLGLWCTWHPEQVPLATFLSRCQQLDRHGAVYSTGIVGLREHYQPALELRSALSPNVYVWVNAYKDVADYYTDEDIARWSGIDPLFSINRRDHDSFGRACNSGDTVISVDGEGTIRRCHFIPEPLGNIYQAGFEKCLAARVCTNEQCGCHIGYVHMPDLGLESVFGDGLLERVPIAGTLAVLRKQS